MIQGQPPVYRRKPEKVRVYIAAAREGIDRGVKWTHAELQEPDRFGAVANELSNCPSGRQGGNLVQIGRGDAVPEFEQALFRMGPAGVLREVVRTRYGFHLVALDRRLPGDTLPFEAVRRRIAERPKAAVEERALRQYVPILAGQSEIVGVDLQAAQTPARRSFPTPSFRPRSSRSSGGRCSRDPVPVLHQGSYEGCFARGAAPEELMEAIWVAAEMRAGGAYAHSALMLATLAEEERKSGPAFQAER